MDTVQIDAILAEVRMALERDQILGAIAQLEALHPVDTADALAELNPAQKAQIIMALNLEDAADLMEEFEDDETVDVAGVIPNELLARLLDEMEPDDAADLLGDLEIGEAELLLGRMDNAHEVRPLLAYEDETTGGLMTSDYPVLRPRWTAQQALDYLRHKSLDDDIHYYIYVVDETGRLIGVAGLRQLITAPLEARIEDFMNREVHQVTPEMDQEEAARLLARYGLLALPVVDGEQRLIGVITHDDLVEVLEDEDTEDIYALSNVGPDSDLTVFSPIRSMVRQRLPWLYINLATAFFASFVISQFQALYAQVAVLAVFQSVVAALGGNSGTQALAIIVRGLALGELEARQARRVLGRELAIGVMHGTAVGLGAATVAALWNWNLWFGVVIGVATLGNLIIGGLAGTLVPLTLKALRLDPALASSVLVTMITDSGGFALFLGLASWMLPMLV